MGTSLFEVSDTFLLIALSLAIACDALFSPGLLSVSLSFLCFSLFDLALSFARKRCFQNNRRTHFRWF